MRTFFGDELSRVSLLSTRSAILAVVVSAFGVAHTTEADAADESDVLEVAARIDAALSRRWDELGVVPAPSASDAAFLRRAALDIAGRIPRSIEVRDFLANPSADKRSDLINELLESPGYVTHFQSFWRAALIPEASADFQVAFLIPSFEAWLREQLIEDVAYDEIVRRILTCSLDNQSRNPTQVSPVAFFQAKQIAPENLAAAASRTFLGIRLECAQCHDHPFDTWKQEQFWSFAAFFAGIERSGNSPGIVNSVRELFNKRELKIPGTEQVVKATYLDGSEPDWSFRGGPRATLANWITASDNQYFARAAVNRMWGHFFGEGLVNPIDDFSSSNPCSHPELLDDLSREFASHQFDIKFLIRVLTSTKAYRMTSRQTHESQDQTQLFAKMAVKGLSPTQLFDSLAQATGFFQPFQNQPQFAIGAQGPRGEFIETFTNDADTSTERETTILQALAMMNGQFVSSATGLEQSRTLAAIVEFPSMTTEERVESLFLASLSRAPTEVERNRFVAYVESGGPKKDSKAALGDVFWALLNSSEFMFNH